MSGSAWFSEISGYRLAGTYQGDTLQGISLREMGDASLWHGLISINNLLPPYLTNNPALAGARLLLAGRDSIKIPSSVAPSTGTPDPSTVYGTDIGLFSGFIGVDAGGDIATVTGLPNLKQAIELRLGTEPEDLMFHPDYGNGCIELIGASGTDLNLRLAAVFVSQAILSDERIAEMQSCVATISGDTIAVSAVAMAIDGKLIPFSFTLPISGSGTLGGLASIAQFLPLAVRPLPVALPILTLVNATIS